MGNVANDLLNVINTTWPVIFLTCIITIVLRVSFIIKNKIKFEFYNEILMLIFIIYTLCLFQIVTNTDVPGEHGINITLLKEITRYSIGSHLFYRNVIGNIVMFIPFGFFTSFFLKLNKKRYNILMTLFISLTIESIQLTLGRAFDVDDLLLNCLGSFIGYLAYRLIELLFKNKSEKFKGIVTVSLLFVMLLLLALFIVGALWK